MLPVLQSSVLRDWLAERVVSVLYYSTKEVPDRRFRCLLAQESGRLFILEGMLLFEVADHCD